MEDGIVAIVGPLTSTETKAIASVAEAINIPIVAPASTDPLLGESGNTNWYDRTTNSTEFLLIYFNNECCQSLK